MNFPISRVLEISCLPVRLEGSLFHRFIKIEFEQKEILLFLTNYDGTDMDPLRKILNLIFVNSS
jgi:hypothetical protein